jgi:hypothetical protein
MLGADEYRAPAEFGFANSPDATENLDTLKLERQATQGTTPS